MSGFLFRTSLNTTRLLLNRLKLTSSPNVLVSATVQSSTTSTHHSSGTSPSDILSSIKPNDLGALYYSTSKKDDSTAAAGASTQLTQKALEISSPRNLNPFTLFMKENYKSTAQSNPNVPNKQIFAMLASSWRSMSMDEKMKYVETARENQRQKKVQLERFFSSIPEKDASSVMKSMKETRSNRRKELKEFRIRREKKSLNKPKPPPGAFFLYSKTLDRGEADIKEFVKGASMKWKALAQQDKQKFVDQNRKLTEEYQLKLKEWETRMVAEGRVKLVRAKFRKTLENKLNTKTSQARLKRAKFARTIHEKRLRALARKAKMAKKAREKRAKAQQAVKAKKAREELTKAKRLVELASKIKLSAIKKTLDAPSSKKGRKSSSSSKPTPPKPLKFKDDEIVAAPQTK